MGCADTVPFQPKTKHPVLTRPTSNPRNPFSAPKCWGPGYAAAQGVDLGWYNNNCICHESAGHIHNKTWERLTYSGDIRQLVENNFKGVKCVRLEWRPRQACAVRASIEPPSNPVTS